VFKNILFEFKYLFKQIFFRLLGLFLPIIYGAIVYKTCSNEAIVRYVIFISMLLYIPAFDFGISHKIIAKSRQDDLSFWGGIVPRALVFLIIEYIIMEYALNGLSYRTYLLTAINVLLTAFTNYSIAFKSGHGDSIGASRDIFESTLIRYSVGIILLLFTAMPIESQVIGSLFSVIYGYMKNKNLYKTVGVQNFFKYNYFKNCVFLFIAISIAIASTADRFVVTHYFSANISKEYILIIYASSIFSIYGSTRGVNYLEQINKSGLTLPKMGALDFMMIYFLGAITLIVNLVNIKSELAMIVTSISIGLIMNLAAIRYYIFYQKILHSKIVGIISMMQAIVIVFYAYLCFQYIETKAYIYLCFMVGNISMFLMYSLYHKIHGQ
jgi:hypothetical protein